MQTNSDKPLVTIMCMTYNHLGYIKQALDGFMLQETNFPYNILVHDDCSTDGTSEIVREYCARYPDRMRAIIQPENQRSKGIRNFPKILEQIESKFVAICEGDDYWTDPLKLQKQVDFLESHPECSLCFHNVLRHNLNGVRADELTTPTDFPEISTIEDLLIDCFIPTCSVMFRNKLFDTFPDWYYQTYMGDWSLFIMLAKHGDIGYINQNMAVYRIHSEGIWSRLEEQSRFKLWWEARKIIVESLDGTYSHAIKHSDKKILESLPTRVSESVRNIHSMAKVKEQTASAINILNKELALDTSQKTAIWKQVLSDFFFRAHIRGERKGVLHSFLPMIRSDPKMMFNRGVPVIFLKAAFNLGRYEKVVNHNQEKADPQ